MIQIKRQKFEQNIRKESVELSFKLKRMNIFSCYAMNQISEITDFQDPFSLRLAEYYAENDPLLCIQLGYIEQLIKIKPIQNAIPILVSLTKVTPQGKDQVEKLLKIYPLLIEMINIQDVDLIEISLVGLFRLSKISIDPIYDIYEGLLDILRMRLDMDPTYAIKLISKIIYDKQYEYPLQEIIDIALDYSPLKIEKNYFQSFLVFLGNNINLQIIHHNQFMLSIIEIIQCCNFQLKIQALYFLDSLLKSADFVDLPITIQIVEALRNMLIIPDILIKEMVIELFQILKIKTQNKNLYNMIDKILFTIT